MSGGAQSSTVDAPPPRSLDARLAILTTLPPEALQRLLSDDPLKAAPWVHATAEAGLPEGQVRFGRMLLDGAGVAKDETAAIGWFQRAAQAGDAEGENMLGRCFENGWGAPMDPAAAAHWFGRAAAQGHAWACYNLGHLHLDGLGVAQDRPRAFDLYRQAAQAGHVRAMNLLARCFEEGWGVAADAQAARAWYRRSAEGGYFRGQYNYATLLVRERKPDEALTWFEKGLDGAPAASRAAMAKALAASPSPALKDLGRRALQAATTMNRALSPCS